MKVSVWDTSVKREDGLTMHFDILVPEELTDEKQIFAYGLSYLEQKPFKTLGLTSKECEFCHIENATDAVIKQIQESGFYIIEMQNCN